VVLVLVAVGLLVTAGVVAAVTTSGGPGLRPPSAASAAAAHPARAGSDGAAGSAALAAPIASARLHGSPASGPPASGSPVSGRPSASAGPAAKAGGPLGSQAAAYVAGRAGTVLAAVQDLRTGQTWTLGQGRAQDEASVVKLDVLETLLARDGGSGLSAADQDLAGEMIEDSDNDAATSLWDQVGGAGGIGAFNASAGLAATTPSACVNCPGFSWPGWGLTTTTPGDQLRLLRALVEPNSLLTGAERQYGLSLMENVTADQRWGVSGGVPAGATVALKNGWLPLDSAGDDWQINSVGWVSGDGRDYLMAVLSTGNPSEQYGIDTIDQLAAMVWAGL
jgi:hypothetical protein